MNKLKQTLEKVLKTEASFCDSESGELNYMKVKDSADRIDEKLITLLADNKDLKAKFFTKIKDVYVFNIQDFKFFLDESKVDNSYTQYANKIGLANNNGLLENTSDVVLNFPFKDCVLEGGQSTEEGTDTYFEFSDKTGKYEEKTGKRNEVFFNQVLAHDEIDRLFDRKALVNWKRFTKDSKKDGEAVKEIKRDKTGLIQENLIIKGNNLLALHSLKSEFAGKIKLIYIDPPYNTGSDSFAYNDNFSKSAWLTFMKNRIDVAKELLLEAGLLFIQCDYNQDSYLRVLLDEDNDFDFIANIAVKSSTPSGLKTTHKDKKIIKQKDTILFYSKKGKQVKLNPQYEKKNDWDSHYSYIFDRKSNKVLKLKDVLVSNKIIDEETKLDDVNINDKNFKDFYIKHKLDIFRTAPEMPEDIKKKSKQNPDKIIEYGNDSEKQYAWNGNRMTFLDKAIKVIDGKEYLVNLVCDFWADIDFQNTQNEGGVSLPNGKKPEKLLQRIIDLTTTEGDIVLDYHLGSGTTCAVAHKMNRQYIGIEQLNYEENDSVIRLKNVINGDSSGVSKTVNWQGGGDFIYFELAKWNEKAKEEIQNTKDLPALIKLFDTLYERYFLNYNVKIKDFKEKIIKEEEFKKLTLAQQKQMFLTMLDLNQMYVNESEMADKKYGISTEDQKLTKAFYSKK